jgi:hypothetical protein
VNSTKLIALSGLVTVAALASGLSGHAMLLGFCAIALMSLLATLGLGAHSSALTKAVVVFYGVLFCFLIYLSFALHAPDQPLVTFGGFPPGTAVLIYAIGPLGMILGALYALSFDSEVLPRERYQQFVDRFGTRK